MPKVETPAVSRPSVILAFDVGRKKTGIAVGNRISGGARPLGIVYGDTARQFTAIDAYMEEWRPGGLVVGLPTHADGTPHNMTARARRFAHTLQSRFSLPVQFADERHSTQRARECSKGNKGQEDVDATAAALILQDWLDSPAAQQDTSNHLSTTAQEG